MEPERYTQYLPSDLTYELALRRPWRDLQTTYSTLPEYRQLALDPNHPVWKKLYHHDLSSYDLPAGADYRDQYFLGMELADNPYMDMPLRDLAELGYDQALKSRYGQDKIHEVDLQQALYAAIGKGYLNIVEFLIPDRVVVDQPARLLLHAAEHGQRDVLTYLITTYGPLSGLDWGYNRQSDLVRAAARGGHSQLMWVLSKTLGYTNYQQLLEDAAESDNTQLFDELAALSGLVLTDATRMQLIHNHVGHVKMYYHLLPDAESIDPNVLAQLAVNDCDLSELKRADQLGANPEVLRLLLIPYSCQDPEVYEWFFQRFPAAAGDSLSLVVARLPQPVIDVHLKYLNAPIVQPVEVLRAAAHRSLSSTENIMNHPHITLTESDMAQVLLELLMHRDMDPVRVEYLYSRLADDWSLIPYQQRVSIVVKSRSQLVDALTARYTFPAGVYVGLIHTLLTQRPDDWLDYLVLLDRNIPPQLKPSLAAELRLTKSGFPVWTHAELDEIIDQLANSQ